MSIKPAPGAASAYDGEYVRLPYASAIQNARDSVASGGDGVSGKVDGQDGREIPAETGANLAQPLAVDASGFLVYLLGTKHAPEGYRWVQP